MVQICYFDCTDRYPTSLLKTIFMQHKTNRIGNIRWGLEWTSVAPHSCFLLPHYTVKEQIIVILFEAVWNQKSTEKLKNGDRNHQTDVASRGNLSASHQKKLAYFASLHFVCVCNHLASVVWMCIWTLDRARLAFSPCCCFFMLT